MQLERAVAAHDAIQAVEEETAEVGGRRQLANVLDVALPTEQGRGPQAAVLAAVVEVEPGPQALVQLFQRQRLFAIQVVQELFPTRPAKAFDLAPAFRLIRRGMDDERADRCRDPGQLRAAVDLGVIHIQPDRDTAGRDGLAQAVQANVQTFAGIELGVRDEPAGVIEDGM